MSGSLSIYGMREVNRELVKLLNDYQERPDTSPQAHDWAMELAEEISSQVDFIRDKPSIATEINEWCYDIRVADIPDTIDIIRVEYSW